MPQQKRVFSEADFMDEQKPSGRTFSEEDFAPSQRPTMQAQKTPLPAYINEKRSSWDQFKDWAKRIAVSADPTVGGQIRRGMLSREDQVGSQVPFLEAAELAPRAITNPLLRFFDPTSALGGKVTNLMEGRPFEHDPNAREGVETLIQSYPVVGAIKASGIPKASEALQAIKKGKITYSGAKEFIANKPIEAAKAAKTRAERLRKISSLEKSLKSQTETKVLEAQQRLTPIPSSQEATTLASDLKSAIAKTKKSDLEAAETLQKSQVTQIRPESPVPTAQAAESFAKARETKVKEIQGTLDNIYNNIREEMSKVKVTKPTGKMKATGMVDAKGKPIMEAETQILSSPVTGFKTPQLVADYDRLKNELKVALSQDSPGAKALIEIMEGPKDVDGITAIDNLRALNNIGYAKADRALSTNSQRLAREAAYSYREALKSSIRANHPPEVAEKMITDLGEAAIQLEKRKGLIGTKAAKGAASSMERYGNFAQLANDPRAATAAWNIMDSSSRQLGKNQILEKLIGNNPMEFTKKWTSLNPEVKKLIFTPDELAKADQLATNPESSLKAILANYETKKEGINKFSNSLRTLRQQREAQLARLEAMKGARTKQIEDRANTLRRRIQEMKEEERIEIAQRTKEAQEFISKRQRMQKIGWYGLAAFGLWKARNALEAVLDALGYNRGGF